MTFNALYETDIEDDVRFRVIEAANLQDAKAVLKAQIEAEGNHGDYRLCSLYETDESLAARRGW